MVAFAALGLGSTACADDLARATAPQPRSIESTTIDPVTFDAVYVVNHESASISVIDATNNVVAGTITLRGVAYPHRIAISPDRSALGLAVPGFDLSGGEFGHEHHASRPGHVILLDALTGQLGAVKQLDAANYNVTFSGDGKSIWTSQSTSPGSTVVLDAHDLATRETIPVGTSPASTFLARDGTAAYVANSGSASVTVIDVASSSVRKTISVGDGPIVAQPGNDGYVYVENEPDESISVINGTTLDVERTLSLGYTPGSITTAPDGTLWITSPGRGVVEVRDREGQVVRSVESGRGAHFVVFSADGARAYVSNQFEDNVSVVDVATMTVTTKIAVGSKPNAMVWRSK